MKTILLWIPLFTFTCYASSLGDDWAVESVAGTGAPENNGDTGDARTVNIGEPFGVEIGPDGALYITEIRNHRVRRLDLKSGDVRTVAGSGRRGYSGDGGPATDAELNEPYEVRFDPDGNMVFVEMRNHIVRRVDTKTKIIRTIAGTGQQGFAGDGGPATRAKFSQPHSIALDENGAIYVADIGNHRIRRIDPKTGNVDSIAGNSKPQLPQDGQKARGNPIFGPRALCIDGESLWIALREGHSIWRMDLADGILDRIAGTGEPGFAGDGRPARLAKFNGPKGIAVGPHKKLFVADTENDAVRMIDLQTGIISTIGAHRSVVDANNTTNATIARLNRPHGICAGPRGEVFVGDTLNHLVRRMK